MEMLDSVLHYVLFVIWVTNVECSGTLKVDPNSDLSTDANRINEAFGYWNANEEVFLEILPRRSCDQRSQIYQKLDQEKRQDSSQYNYNSGDSYIGIMMCFFCGPTYYTMWFQRAIEDEDTNTLTELLVLLSFDDVKNQVLDSVVDDDDSRSEEKTLRELWNSKMDGDYKNWGNEMMTRNRDKSKNTDQERAKADAQDLIREKDEGFCDHRQKLDEILAERSIEQARLTMDEFEAANDNKSLFQEIIDQLDDELENAYTDLIFYITEGKDHYLAMRLFEAMSGMGTDDKNLTRLIIYTAETDLVEVSAAYQKRYGVSLTERIQEDTSGFEKSLLLAFMGN